MNKIFTEGFEVTCAMAETTANNKAIREKSFFKADNSYVRTPIE
jgi:hypothetical protein